MEYLQDCRHLERLLSSEEWKVYEKRLLDQLQLAIDKLVTIPPDQTAALVQAKGEIAALKKALELPAAMVARAPEIARTLDEREDGMGRVVSWVKKWWERRVR